MKSRYPLSFGDLRSWAAENNVGAAETRVRFAQYAILRAVTSSRALSSALVFKGGNALDFVWQPNRSTRDLDFSLDIAALDQPPTPEVLRSLLEPALGLSSRTLGVALRLHQVEQQPPGSDKTFVTFRLRVGYALQDEVELRRRMDAGVPSNRVIPVDISLNEPLSADEGVDIHGLYRLRVSTLEDIVAEKLRAFLQQKIRNRVRSQDLLDVAVVLRTHPGIDRELIARFLVEKSRARDVLVSRAAFLDPDLASRARQDYEPLRMTTREIFIPFAEALEALYLLVNSLDIPRGSPNRLGGASDARAGRPTAEARASRRVLAGPSRAGGRRRFRN